MVGIRIAWGLTGDEGWVLADLLIAVVDEGASVGFLPPLDRDAAVAYWERVGRSAVAGALRLLVAETDGRIVGTAQLLPAESANGRHRAEVAKLLVHPNARRRGIGRALMERLEAEARADGRTLLHLDTREGDPASALYRALGYREAGRIPGWARAASGDFAATVFFYKELG